MKSLELAKKLIHDAKVLKQQNQDTARINDLVQKAIKEQMKAVVSPSSVRKGMFDTSLATNGPNVSNKGRSLNKLLLAKSGLNSDEREFQKACDDAYLVSVITGVHPSQLQCFKQLQNTKIFKTAYSTEDFTDTYWWPNTLSRDMIEQVEAELKVAALHRTIEMPTNPYKIPGKTGRAITYLVDESTDEAGTKPPSSKGPLPSGVGVLFDAKKLMAYVPISDESTEDLVIPIMGMIKEDVAKSMAEAIEQSTINGQIAGDTIDTQLGLAGNDARRSWNGHRVHAFGGGWVQDLSAWSPTAATALLRKMRAAMGRYGVNPGKLAWVCSIKGYNQMLTNEDVKTLDKYGANATLITGEMARFDNIPVVISEYVPENLNANGAYTSDVDNDYTMIELVYADGWAHGERTKFTVRQGEEIKTDQKFIVSKSRRDFQPLYKGPAYADSIICVGYGLPNNT